MRVREETRIQRDDDFRAAAGDSVEKDRANLERDREELREILNYLKWCQFLDNDPKSREFIAKLDMSS